MFENVRDHVADRGYVAVIHESDQSPTNGPGRPIAPPTYAGEKGTPAFAFTGDAYVPTPDTTGWHTTLRRDSNGDPVRAGRVCVSSVPAESGRGEEALWHSQKRIGVTLPGIIVGPPAEADADAAIAQTRKSTKSASAAQLNQAEAEARSAFKDFEVSTWTAAHRQADAWIKYAANPDDGSQIWQGGVLRDLITSASVYDGDALYRHFPNSGYAGMWLSSGVSRRHRIPRAYSSEIVGYEATGISRAATKLDVTGGASRDTALTIKDGELINAKGHKPSDLGFGQIPTSPRETLFQCGFILQQSSISLPVFRSFQYADDDDKRKARAAATVYTLLAITAHELAAEDAFLRSECSLVRGASRWGWRSSGNGPESIETLEVTDADTAAEALRDAVASAADVGLAFADPIHVPMSRVQAVIVAERVAREVSKSTTENDD
nr:type I-U CRISPR-associated protein Cas7 [Gordonia humi]